MRNAGQMRRQRCVFPFETSFNKSAADVRKDRLRGKQVQQFLDEAQTYPEMLLCQAAKIMMPQPVLW